MASEKKVGRTNAAARLALSERERREVVPLAAPTKARCDGCLFGRCVTVTITRGSEVIGQEERCECHVARPTREGFPCVRRDDWCSLHVEAKTRERTFGGVVMQSFQ